MPTAFWQWDEMGSPPELQQSYVTSTRQIKIGTQPQDKLVPNIWIFKDLGAKFCQFKKKYS
jgi:hypothetical protein